MSRTTNCSAFPIPYIFLLILLFAVGCPQNVKPPEDQTRRTRPVNIKKESVIGRSVEGRPIKSIVLTSPELAQQSPGAEERRGDVVLMVAALHGDEGVGTPLLYRLSQYLMEHKQLLYGRKVVLLPEVNPDGIEKKTRRNVNNVDINRDFLSEAPQPETQAVLDAINTYRPNRIITIRELRFIDYDGADMAAAKAIAEHIQSYADGLPIRQIPTSRGSLGQFGERRGMPVITLGVRRSASLEWEKVWERYGDAIIAGATFPQPVPEDIRVASADLTESSSDTRTRDAAKRTPDTERPTQSSVSPPEPDATADEHLDRGKTLFEAGDYSAALKAFQAAEQAGACAECGEYIQKSRAAEADLAKAIARYNEDDFKGAVAPLTRVLDLNPKDATAAEYLSKSYFGMGNALFKKGAYSAASEQFKTAQRYGECPSCRESLSRATQAEDALTQGIAHHNNGAYKAAIDELAVVIRINPGDKRPADYLYRSHYQLGENYLAAAALQDALYHFEKALEYNPECGECRDRLKVLHYELGRNYFVEAGSQQGDDAIKSLENAIREWKSVAALDPDYENVTEKIARAEEYKARLQNAASE